MLDIEELKLCFVRELENAASSGAVNDLKVKYLGKKGLITEQLRGLAGITAIEDRRALGAKLNVLKHDIQDAINARIDLLSESDTTDDVEFDYTLPVYPKRNGTIHPLSKVKREALSILSSMGFQVVHGPEIEDEWHNFSALNTPDFHPARQMQDSFYFDQRNSEGSRMMLRTQTSSVQIRVMKNGRPPFRITSVGAVYRRDWDATHSPMFHQIEGLWVDESISFANMKWCIEEFTRRFFDVDNLQFRFRPSFFPFTEPSAEVDISYSKVGGKLKIGAGAEWMEIAGCGMVSENVLRGVGVDVEKYRGFAFGVGIERIAMLKYGISDLRMFFDTDLRWHASNGFSPYVMEEFKYD